MIKWLLFAVLLVSALLYFFQLGAPTVWDQDEGQMLASSLEMVKSGEYLTPHLNSSVYFHKPPLYAWMTTVLFNLFGFSEFIGRFWASIFGILGVFVTYKFGKALYNERAGLLAALMLAFSPLYIVLSKMALVDIFLTVFMTLSVYMFYLGYKNPSDKKYFYFMYIFMALGAMTKGPLGLLVPGAAIIFYLLVDRKIGFVKEMVPIKGLLLFLLIASPWFIIETIRCGSYFLKIIFGQFLFAIYMSPMQQHPGPFYYYIIVALVGFLPWSGFFVASLFKKPHFLPLSLLLIMLGLFSTASTKVPGYFLPAFPAMALMAGAFLDEAFSNKNKLGYYLGVILPIVILSITSWAIIAVWTMMAAQIPTEYRQAVIYLQTLIFLALAGFFLSFLFSFMKPQPAWTITGFAVSIIVFFLGLIVWLLPFAENYKPSYDLALSLKGYEHVAFYRTWLPPSLIFYLNRQRYPTVAVDIQNEKDLAVFFKQDKSAAYIPEEELKKIKLKTHMLKSKAGYVIISK